MIVSPTDSQIYAKVKALIAAIVPAGTVIRQGLQNRAGLSAGSNFATMQIMTRSRLATNHDVLDDPYPAPDPGSRTIRTPTRVMLQLDFYGPEAGANAQMVSQLWRDEFACSQLAPECQPLTADEARQIPFRESGEEQYIARFALTAELQYNPTVSTPQEFAGAAEVTLIDVDELIPP